jgi:predicted ferric reductase
MSSGLTRPWRNPIILGGLFLILGIPLATWWGTVGSVGDYFRYSVPDGQRLYLLAKLVGLYAMVGFWLQASYGLLGATWRRRIGVDWGISFHRGLGLSVLTIATSHAALFIVAVAVRTNQFPSQYLLISFDHGFYRSMIALGLIALIATAVAIVAALTRSRLGQYFRYAHWIALPAFLLAIFHSWRIGSETRTSPLSVLYLIMLVSLIGLVILRLASATRRT